MICNHCIALHTPHAATYTTAPHVTHHCTSAASYSLCLCCAVAQVVCGWKSLRLRRLHFYFLRLRWKSLRLRRLRRLRLFRVWVWGRLWSWCVASMFVGCVGRFWLPFNVFRALCDLRDPCDPRHIWVAEVKGSKYPWDYARTCQER